MEPNDDTEHLLRSSALQTANTILLARQRAEQELLQAKQALELKTEELAHSLSMMRATLESTSDGILVTDEKGNVTDFNENYVAMWRMPREIMDARGRSKFAAGGSQAIPRRAAVSSRGSGRSRLPR